MPVKTHDEALMAQFLERVNAIAGCRHHFPLLRQRVNGKALVYFDNAATSQKRGRHTRPMIAPRVFVDLGRTAELPPNNHGNLLVQAPLVQIFDQRADSLIQQRQISARVLMIIPMVIPKSEGNGHAACARLNTL